MTVPERVLKNESHRDEKTLLGGYDAVRHARSLPRTSAAMFFRFKRFFI